MKFLTDAQVNFLIVQMLRAIGWVVETVYEHGLDREKDDARLVAWAREHGFVFLSFDEFRGQTRVSVAEELRERGGRVITVGGGPDQPPERALGRLLFHYPEWFPFLQANEGRVHISDTKHNCRTYPRDAVTAEIHVSREPQFQAYLDRREAARQTPRPRRNRTRKTPTEQHDLPTDAPPSAAEEPPPD